MKTKYIKLTRQEFEGKSQIEAALANIGMDLDIDNLDPDEYEPIQEGEEPRHYPDDDTMDLAKDKFINEFQRGEH